MKFLALALLMTAPAVFPARAEASTADRVRPSTPSGLRLHSVDAGKVELVWRASRDNVGVAAYDVIRNGAWVATRTAVSYTDVRVGPGGAYTYRVRARDRAGNASGFSSALTVTTPKAFSFGAAGDHGADAKTAASLAALDASGASFYLALGDLDYGETDSPAAWCSFVKSRLRRRGPNFPFQLVAGNHENDVISQHARCLPDRLGSILGPNRQYAAEYYFDYPRVRPLVRVVMISPNLTINGHRYAYGVGSAHYRWVASVLEAARRAGTPWVVVGMHKNCISAGGHACSIGADLMNLLIAKKVDLVLQGHVHSYQRSKQLSLGSACTAIVPDAYNARCVVDDGRDGRYSKRRGTVTMIIGVFGKDGSSFNASDAEAGYFVRGTGAANGFVRFTVSRSRIAASFVRSTGTFTDSFTIS